MRNYAYLWSDKVVKKGHILSLISSAVLSYLIIPGGDYPRLSINTKQQHTPVWNVEKQINDEHTFNGL